MSTNLSNDNASLNMLIENFPDLIYWKDKNFIYQGCNKNVAHILGYKTPTDIIGKTDQDLANELGWNNDRIKKIHEDDALIIESGMEISKEDAIPLNGQTKIYSTNKKPLYKNGEIIGILGISTDITDSKIIEEELRAAKEKNEIYLHSIVENLPQLVYWKDKDFIYQGCNNLCAEVLNLQNPAQIVGKSDNDFGWSKERIEELHNVDRKIIKNGIPQVVEDIIPIKHSSRIFLTSKTPLIDMNGNIIGVLGISTDISDMKKMEEDLKKAKEAAEAANIAKTVFIANISHDIRTPLSSVIGLSNIIENAEIDPKFKMHAHNIAQSGDELLNMLNRVISSVSSGKLTVDDVSHEPFDLRYLIESLINLESSPADLKHIQLITYIDDQIPNLLIGDHDKLYHIILNLVGNALKFTEKGHIKISIALTKKLSDSVQLLFEVSDTGMGIPPESLNKVFDMFYKVTPSYKGKDKGHGMGLYIVKTYTELLGGHVSVESKLNEGSKFSFTLTLNIAEQNAKPQNIVQLPSIFSPNKDAMPVQQTVVSKISDPSKTLAIEKPQNTPEILAIEDNKAMLSLVETLIKKEKCTPTTAEDGESGLELAKTKHFDLILSDVGLPGISGIEFAQKLRQYEKEHNKKPVPIVAITGHGQVIQKECLAAGMNYVILKPIKPETLTELCSKFALFSEANNTSSPLDKLSLESIPTQKVGHLGPDLPDTEAELFEIDALPIFDIENAGKLLGDNTALLMKMLRDNLNIMIPQELPRLKKAHEDSDWQTIAAISHKLKGGFLSISLTRLAIACQYLERYQQAGHSTLLERLYQQVLKVIEITSEQLRPWAE